VYLVIMCIMCIKYIFISCDKKG